MIEDRIIKTVSNYFRDSSVEYGTNLYFDLKADSFDLIQLIHKIETEFKINIDFDDKKGIVYVKDIIDIVEKYLDQN